MDLQKIAFFCSLMWFWACFTRRRQQHRERCESGLIGCSRKALCPQGYQRFESFSLRQNLKPHMETQTPLAPNNGKRILLAGGLLILFMVASIPLFIPAWNPLFTEGPETSPLTIVFLIVYLAAFLLFMQWVTVWVFFYPAIGLPQPAEHVRAQLRDVASWLPGATIREKGKKFQFCFVYPEADRDSYGVGRELTIQFVATLRFREDRHQCRMTKTWTQRYLAASWWLGIVRGSWMIHRGEVGGFYRDRLVGFDVLGGRLKQKDPYWSAEEVQNAIVTTLVQNGWSVHSSLF